MINFLRYLPHNKNYYPLFEFPLFFQEKNPPSFHLILNPVPSPFLKKRGGHYSKLTVRIRNVLTKTVKIDRKMRNKLN